MEGAMCTVYPTAKGKKSKLYGDMYNKTGHDRKLTNFLYAMSKLDNVRAQFNKKQFDRLGEIKSDAFMDWVHIEDLIKDQNALQQAKNSLGAENPDGTQKGYDTPEEILDRVIDFNNNNTRMKAMIRFSNGQFVIDVENLNAENYGANRSLIRRKIILDAITGWLNTQGLKTDFSPEVKTRYANTLSALGFERTIKDMIDAFGRDRYRANPDAARLIMDMFEGSPLLDTIKNGFGDDLANAISYRTGNDQAPITPETLDLLRDRYWSDQLNLFLQEVKRKMSRLDASALEAKKEHELSRFSDDTEYFNIPASEIHEALTELYRVSHVDKEEVLTDIEQATKLSEAARAFLNNKYIELETFRRKTGGKKRGDDKELRKIEQEIERGRYGDSIISMLSDLAGEINTTTDLIAALDTSFAAAPDTLTAVNEASKIIIRSSELADVYRPILERLLSLDGLELDELGLTEDMIEAIQQLASSLNEKLTTLRRDAKRKQFDVVYAYYSIYWGNSDQRNNGEEMVSLREILETARKDINFFDRYIYAMGESNDEALALFAAAVRDRNQARDKIARRGDTIIRRLTNDLFEAGSDAVFMYERKDSSPTGKIISDVDWDAFEAKRKQMKEYYENQGYSQREVQRRLESWENNNTEWVTPFTHPTFRNAYAEYLKVFHGDSATPSEYDFKIRIPLREKFGKALPNMTQAQQDYYYKMMALKAAVTYGLPTAEFGFFDAPQISTDVTTALKESGGDPSKVLQIIKNKIVDALVKREDDTDYGDFMDTLGANNISLRHSDLSGQEAQTLPLFFTHKIKDPSRLSLDFSRGIEAIMTSSVQYNEMNKALDALMLAKDWLINRRNIAAVEGDKTLMDIYTWGRDVMIRTIKKTPATALSAGLVADFTEVNIFGKRHKDGKGHVSVFGLDVSYDKLTGLVTGYTSYTGLSLNLLGAQANALVGKLQMCIEGACGEFYNIADWGYAEWEYFQEIWPMLAELASNKKTSDLALLMDYFDVKDEFIENLKADGFYNNIVGKIIGNANILFMYGMGEHMLHAETMLAILHRKKVVNRQTGQTVSLRKVFEKKVESGTGELVVDYSKWDIIDAEGNRRALTEKDLDTIKGQVSYCNKTMHGAFGQLDKGMVHRYCFGRLIMNFRQWMPGHYERRFRGLHYNYDLNEWREGYYTTSLKFLADTVKEWNDGGWQLITRWHQLNDMQQANIKRAVAEIALLVGLCASTASLGRYKDKKGNWAYRNLMYQLMRMRMETRASVPFSPGFVTNIITILNSPAACITQFSKLAKLLSLTDLAVTIESGKYEGENLWVHNAVKAVPFLKQVQNQLELATEDDLFQVFK